MCIRINIVTEISSIKIVLKYYTVFEFGLKQEKCLVEIRIVKLG